MNKAMEILGNATTKVANAIGALGAIVLIWIVGVDLVGWSMGIHPPDKHEIKVCEAMLNFSNGRQLDEHCRRVLAESVVSDEERAAKP